ncbi:hypothetical protein HDU96_005293 [Phlyctochytrium bullatum]|nr:hypothetical protein HDU96_005293 [Phlyctochytrium bullatum]
MPSNVRRAVLWVDDNPQNNADLIREAENNGIEVIPIKTTAEALNILRQLKPNLKSYNLRIITDMHRKENNRDINDAGVQLVKALHDMRIHLPCMLYCSWYGHLEKWRAECTSVYLTASSEVADARKFVLFLS